MTRLACIKCQRFLTRRKIGVWVMEEIDGKPFRCWHADRFECRTCNTKILGGFAEFSWKENFHEGFDKLIGTQNYTINGDKP